MVTGEFQTGEVDFNAILANDGDAGAVGAQHHRDAGAHQGLGGGDRLGGIGLVRQLGITCPIMAGDTWENTSIIENAGADTSEVYISTFFDG